MSQPDARREGVPTLAEIFFGHLANFWRRRRARRGRKTSPLRFETLENRLLLSADLIFNAPANLADDSYTLRLDSGNGDLELLNGTTVVASQALAETTRVIISGEDGWDDSLTVDFAHGGFFSLDGGITFNGGADGMDKLSVVGGEFTTVTHTATTTGPGRSGSMVYKDGVHPASVITYTDLEPIDMTGSTITDLVFNLPGTNDQGILEDDGTLANGVSQIRSQNATPTFETTTFSNTVTSLTVNMGGDDGSFTVASLPDFTGSLAINGQAGNDNVTFIGATNLSRAGADLSITVGGSITDAAGTNLQVSDLATLNAGSITLGDNAADTTNFGLLTFNAAGAVNITEDSAMVLTGNNVGSSATLVSGGTTTVNGTLRTTAAVDSGALDLISSGTVTLSGNIVTHGGAVTIFNSVILGSPSTVTIDTTDGGAVPAGRSIVITGTVNDDLVPTSLVLLAGTAGTVNLQGAVGGTTPIQGLTVQSGNTVRLPAVQTREGGVSVAPAPPGVLAPSIVLGGNISTNSGANAGSVSLNGPVRLGTDVTITTDHATGADGNVTFTAGSTINEDPNNPGPRSLAIFAGGGDVSLGGATGPLQGLNIGSANDVALQSVTTRDGGLTITTASAGADTNSIALNGDIDTTQGISAGNVSLVGSVTLANNVDVTAGTGAISAPGAVTFSGVSTVTAATFSVGSLLVSGNGVTAAIDAATTATTVTINGGGTANLNGATTIGALSLTGAVGAVGGLGGSGNVTLLAGGPHSWNSGLLSGSGVLTVASGATLTVGGGDHFANGKPIVNVGTVNWTAGRIDLGGGAQTFANQGTFELAANSQLGDVLSGPAGTMTLTNTGLIRQQVAVITTFSNGMTVNNHGVVQINAGRVNFGGDGGTHTGDFTAAAGAILAFTDGTHAFDPGSSVTVALGGTLAVGGSGTVNLDTEANLSGAIAVDGLSLANINPTAGSITPTTITVGGSSGVLNLTPTNTMTVPTVTISGGGTLNLNDSTTIATTATIGNLSLAGGGSGAVGGLGGSADVTLAAGGTHTWSSGNLEGSGIFTVASGATLTVSGGDHFVDTKAIVNAGTVNWTAGRIDLDGDTSTFANQGTFELAANAEIGVIFGPAGTMTLTNTGLIRQQQNEITTFGQGMTVNNQGLVEILAGRVNFGGNGGTHSGDFTAAAGTTLAFTGGTHQFDPGSSVTVTQGTLLVSNPGGTTPATVVTLDTEANLTGTISVTGAGGSGATATLAPLSGSILPTTVSVTGTFALLNLAPPDGVITPTQVTISGGGTLNLNDSTTIATTATIGNLSLAGGGSGAVGGLGGSADVTLAAGGTHTWSSGNLEGSGIFTVASGATLTVSGGDHFVDTKAIVNAGTVNWTAGRIDLDGDTSTFANQGTFELAANAEIGVIFGPAGTMTLTNTGLIRQQQNEITTFGQGMTVNNTLIGLLDVQSGTVNVTGALIQAGTIDVDSGATFQRIGGFTSSGVLQGNGAFVVGAGNTLINTGAVVPGATSGDTTGTLTITGNYSQGTNGRLNIEVGSTAAGGFDVLAISGSATLASAPTSTLSVALVGGFSPVGGDRFRFMTFASRSGFFGTTLLPTDFFVDQADPTDLELFVQPSIAINDVSVIEGNSGTVTALFNVSLSRPSNQTVTVNYSTTNGTAGNPDYQATSGILTFAPGETSQPIAVNVNGDFIVESNETFFVSLSGPTNSVIGDGQGVGTINDDDTAVYNINDVTVNEGAGTLTFTVSVSNPVDIPVTIDVSYADQSATGAPGGVGADYDNKQNKVVFAALDTTDQLVTVAITNDNIVEATETFLASLGTATALGGRSVDTSDTGTGTITDNDTAAYTINDVTVNEAAGKLTFTVSVSNPVDIPVTIDVSYADQTATGAAGGVGADHDNDQDKAVFAALDTTDQLVTVAITNDNIVEATETFLASLSTAKALGGRSVDTSDTGTGTITDNDTAAYTINDVIVNEADGKLTFTVSVSNPVDIPVTINVSYTDQTTTGPFGVGADYKNDQDKVVFAALDTADQLVTVAINDDNIVEATETFLASLSTKGALGDRSVDTSDTGTGTITDNDTAAYTINDVTVNEGAGTLTFTVSVSNPVDIPVTIDVSYADQTATGAAGGVGADYDNDQDKVLFTALDTADQLVTVAITNDNIAEATETFLASLSTATALGGRSVDTSDTGIGSIENDDAKNVFSNVHYDAGTDTLTFESPGDFANAVTVTSPGANQLRIVVGSGEALVLSGDTGVGFTLSAGDSQLDIDTSAAPVGLFGIALGEGADTLAVTNDANNGLGSLTADGGGGSDTVTLNAISLGSPSLGSPFGGSLSVTADSISVNGTLSTTAGLFGSVTLIGSGTTTTLNDDIITAGGAITIDDSIILSDEVTVTLDTTNGGAVAAGANINFSPPFSPAPGTINDDASPTGLELQAGHSGFVIFRGAVGNIQAPESLTINALNVFVQALVTTGTQSITARDVFIGGPDGAAALIANGSQSITAEGTLTVQGVTSSARIVGNAGQTISASRLSIASVASFAEILQTGATGSQEIEASSITINGGGSGTIAQIQAAGHQLITASGGLIVESSTGGSAQLTANGGQTINAQYVEVIAQRGDALIQNNASGTQLISTHGTNAAGQGLSVSSLGGGSAIISQNVAGGQQVVTVLDADFLVVNGTSGNAGLFAISGAQTISITGSGANAILVGSAGALGGSNVVAFTQNITAGLPGEDGSIAIVGPAANNRIAGIVTQSGIDDPLNLKPQTISTSGTITVIGGIAPTQGGNFNSGIFHNRQGLQSVTAADIVIQGGSAGTGNGAFVNSGNGGDQLITVSGGITLNGGSGVGTANNRAGMNAINANQTITGNPDIVVSGGASGGAVGLANTATIQAGAGKLQVINAASIVVAAGTGGTDNTANITGGIQTITTVGDVTVNGGASDAGAAGIARIGGPGGLPTDLTLNVHGNLTLNAGSELPAAIGSNRVGGQPTDITINVDGHVTLNGGTNPAGNPRIGSPEPDTAVAGGDIEIHAGLGLAGVGDIVLNGGSQIRTLGTVTLTTPGKLALTGGNTGSGNAALIQSNDNQTISANRIELTGGSGGAPDLGNFARITSVLGLQTITAGSSTTAGAITLTAGASGINNYASITGPNQAITVHGNLTLTGGGSAASAVTGGGARIGGLGGATQGPTFLDLTVRTVGTVGGNVTMTGGIVEHAGSVIGSNFLGGQTTDITMRVDGSLTMNPGTVPNSGARIGSPSTNPVGGDISITAGGNITMGGSLTVGALGTVIRTIGGKVTLDADGAITIAGSVLSGAQTLSVGGNLTVTATGATSAVLSASGPQTIDVGGTLTVRGGSAGSDRFAMILGIGEQTIDAAQITLQGGSGGTNNFALITGSIQVISSVGNVELRGGAGNGNSARIGGLGGGGAPDQPTNLTLEAGGDVLLQGGNVTGTGAQIGPTGTGAPQPTAITITAGQNVILNAGAAAAARIGSANAGTALGDISIAAGASIQLNGTAQSAVIRTLGDVKLHAGTTISEIANGFIVASGLVTTSTAGTILTGPNQVAVFNGSSVSGDITLNNTSPLLTVTGINQAPLGTLTINQAGNLTLTGTITSGPQTISATGDITISSPGGPDVLVSAAGLQTVNAGGGLVIQSSAAGSAQLLASGGQTIDARFVEVTALSGSVLIQNNASGTQLISTHGTNAVGQGLSLFGGSALISQNVAGGTQVISVTNADRVTLDSPGGGAASIFALPNGTQTLSITGAGANALVLGSPGSLGISQIAGAFQTIIAGSTGEAGSITIFGRAASRSDAANSFIVSGQVAGGTQTVSTTGALTVIGGTAPTGAVAGIFANGTNGTGSQQTINAGSIFLQGGNGGNGNGAQIAANSGSQLVIVTGGGISLIGGTGGTNNQAAIREGFSTSLSAGESQTVTVIGGGINLQGGSGTGNGVFISGTVQDISATGSVTLSSSVSSGNSAASIGSVSTKPTNLELRAGGDVVLTGGAANSAAFIGSAGTIPGPTNDIKIVAGGSVILNVGAGSGARIGSSTAAAAAAGSIKITAGSVTPGGDIVLNSNATQVARIRTLGNVELHADSLGGTISEGPNALIEANALTTTSHSGTNLTGPNQVTVFNATNTTSGNVSLVDGGGLTVTGISNPVGEISVSTIGQMTVTGSLDSGTHDMSLTAPGGVFFTASAVVNVDLGGTAANQFTNITILDNGLTPGVVTLDGTLDADLVNGFMPAAGNRFQFMTFASQSGSFDATNLPAGFTLESNPGFLELVFGAANAAPVFVEIADQTVEEGHELSFTVSATDPDDPANELVYSATGLPAGATFDPVTREFSWIPADDAVVTVTFLVTDPDGATDTMDVVLTATNVAPTVDAGANQMVGLQKVKNEHHDHDDDDDDDDDHDHGHGHGHGHDREATVDITAVFNDLGTLDTHANLNTTINWGDGTVDVGTVSESPFGPPGSTAGADGTVTGTHTYTAAGVYTVTVTVTDDNGGVHSDTLQVTVKKPTENKHFKARGDEYKLNEDSVLQVDAENGVLDNDRGPAGATLQARLVEGPDHGELVFNADGSFIYTPDADFNGKDWFWYEFTDGVNVSEAVKVQLKIKAVYDAPVSCIDWHAHAGDGWGAGYSPFGSQTGSGQSNFSDFGLELFK